MDKKAAAAESKMRYQYSVRVLKTCVDAPDKVKEATEILQELAEGGYVEAQCSLGDYYSQGFHIEPDQAKAAYWYEESTKRGSLKAAETLAGLYCCHAPDGMFPEQASELALKWHKKWFSMLEAEAEKGGIKEAEALMNGYMYQTPLTWRENRPRHLLVNGMKIFFITFPSLSNVPV